ncbi:MAG: hypothetical protein KC457_12200, partial [Myxococcales bacterium]|nr:hypothetical protein [Myxococcales bacterium]
RSVMPTPSQRAGLAAPLRELGTVPDWLAWIHGFLAWRWLRHPLHPAATDARHLRASAEALNLPGDQGEAFGAGWARWLGEQGDGPEQENSKQEAPCSAP